MNDFPLASAQEWMPDGLHELEKAAAAEDIQIVSKLRRLWSDGTERYEHPGERLLVATDSDQARVVAVGGLTRCPDVTGALRVRRFYVGPEWRRRGIAQAIAQNLITEGLRHTHTLSCNAGASPQAPVFWEALGFNAVDPGAHPGITHLLRRE